jgi:hypothetical protein
MAKYILARTARFLQGVGQYSQPSVVQSAHRQAPLLVRGLSKADHNGIIPSPDGGGESDGTEGIANDFVQQTSLFLPFAYPIFLPDWVIRRSPVVLYDRGMGSRLPGHRTGKGV